MHCVLSNGIRNVTRLSMECFVRTCMARQEDKISYYNNGNGKEVAKDRECRACPVGFLVVTGRKFKPPAGIEFTRQLETALPISMKMNVQQAELFPVHHRKSTKRRKCRLPKNYELRRRKTLNNLK